MKEESSVAYFDENMPEYSVGRLNYAVIIINRCLQKDSSLVGIGCRTGNIPEFIRNETPLQNLGDVDVSRKRYKGSCYRDRKTKRKD